MRSGTGVTHLNTQLPHLRMRAIQARATEDRNNDAESDSESEGNSEGEGDDCGLQFADGALEQYQNRPTDEDGTDDGYWGSMLYTDFHRKYRVVLGKKLCKTDVDQKRYLRCTDAGSPLCDAADD